MTKKKIGVLLGLGLTFTLSNAFANMVILAPAASTGAPGSDTVPNNGSAFAGTLVASLMNVAETPGIGSEVNATMSEYVYRTNSGTLDFFYQVTNNQANGSDNLRLVTAGGYTGFTTAVGYNTYSGTGMLADAYRATHGDAIDFDFISAMGASTLGTDAGGLGSTSYWMEIDTNATGYGLTGFLAVQGSGTAGALAYAPIADVPTAPEPATFALLGGGLSLLCIAVVRKRRKAHT